MSKLLRCDRNFLAILFVAVASSWAAADGPPPSYVAGEVVVRLSEAAFHSLAPKHAPEVPAILQPYGVLSLEPTVKIRSNPLLRSFGFHRLFTLRVPIDTDVVQLAERLAALSEVEYAHPNYIGQGGGLAVALDTHYSAQWSLNNTGQSGGTNDADIDAPEAWEIAVGRRETIIAVLDSGSDGDHLDLRRRLTHGGRDYVAEDPDPEGDHPHGTAVAGVIAADPNNAFAISGVDWRSRLQTIKVLNSSNGGTINDLVQGILHTVEQGVNVSNQSLINYPDVPSLANAVLAAHAAGVIQIGCNGNGNTSVLSYPATYPQQLATGWTDHNDDRYNTPGFGSNFNASLDVVAPGANARTLFWASSSDTFDSWFGCSFATPHVSGITGVMLALDPTLTFEQVRDRLQATAEDQVGNPLEDVPGRDNFYGWGRVNLRAALESFGLVSQDVIHVDDIRLRRLNPQTLEVRVTVLDDLTGIEQNVAIDGTLTLPNASTVPLDGLTGASGVAVFTYAPGGNLPAGTFTYQVDGLSKTGLAYDAAANVLVETSHNPDLNGVHINSIEITDDFNALTFEVEVLDDDGRPEGGTIVKASLMPPVGSPVTFEGTTSFANGGVVRFVHAPGTLAPGLYNFQVVLLDKAGFVWETARDVESSETHVVLAASGDFDLDGMQNGIDNCITVSNASQQDADADGVGDACDVCPALIDPAQRDTDGDGAGDRCDCAPYDASETEVGEALDLRLAPDRETVRWNGVAGADYYDVSRGLIAALDGANYGDCVAEDLVATEWADTEVPSAGQGFFYLVRADDAICGPGTLGQDGSGMERVNGSAQACIP